MSSRPPGSSVVACGLSGAGLQVQCLGVLLGPRSSSHPCCITARSLDLGCAPWGLGELDSQGSVLWWCLVLPAPRYN
jgi:hypothetical protein